MYVLCCIRNSCKWVKLLFTFKIFLHKYDIQFAFRYSNLMIILLILFFLCIIIVRNQYLEIRLREDIEETLNYIITALML